MFRTWLLRSARTHLNSLSSTRTKMWGHRMRLDTLINHCHKNNTKFTHSIAQNSHETVYVSRYTTDMADRPFGHTISALWRRISRPPLIDVRQKRTSRSCKSSGSQPLYSSTISCLETSMTAGPSYGFPSSSDAVTKGTILTRRPWEIGYETTC